MILNPIPGSTRERNDGGYAADSGLDLLTPPGTPCIAVADGELVYSEAGHTPWVEDTNPDIPGLQGPHSILLRLKQTFSYGGLTVRFAWYTHLTAVEYDVPDGSQTQPVRAGEVIGWTGIGNRGPHLHFGLLSARSQGPGEFLSDRQVADLVWPVSSPRTPSEPPAQHATPHRSKLYLHDNIARGFRDGAEEAALDIRVRLEPRGKMFVWVNGAQVKARSLAVDVGHE